MPIRSLLQPIARVGLDRRAATIVEFALAAPTFFLLMFAVLGVGLDAFYQQSLDDAVRDAARQVQLGAPASSSAASFVSAVCAEFGILAQSCQTTLTYSVQASTTTAGFSALSPATLNASGRFSNAFFSGNAFAPGVPVLVQVAYPLPFTLPYIGTLITGTNTGSIAAIAAVRAEHYQ